MQTIQVARGEGPRNAVLALGFPLHPPGRPEKSRAAELLGAGVPTLVVQGGNDPFGRPREFPEGPYDLSEVPDGDHVVPIGKARVARPGRDVTILTYAAMLQVALEARLQFTECVDVRTRSLIRHAPTGDPLDHSNPTATSAVELAPPNAHSLRPADPHASRSTYP